ncbi:hypothetical protein [Clostridium kluyveri]|uniref:Uncharacterized protein n=1 Tax=Clostridium kluyveri TaxID=1534 RepID=A0A1L5F469_CLOKL|nr:hypothetical protein [Clostridium kluyveri]APM37794.1 hypothetical protein BS101_03060 [Clostridium kluyveri]
MDKYREEQLRLTKMQDDDWVKTITELKTLGSNAKGKGYCVFYKENNQGEQKEYSFNAVQYVEETKNFIFTKFNRDRDSVDSRVVLIDVEIEKYTTDGDDSDYEFVFSYS